MCNSLPSSLKPKTLESTVVSVAFCLKNTVDIGVCVWGTSKNLLRGRICQFRCSPYTGYVSAPHCQLHPLVTVFRSSLRGTSKNLLRGRVCQVPGLSNSSAYSRYVSRVCQPRHRQLHPLATVFRNFLRHLGVGKIIQPRYRRAKCLRISHILGSATPPSTSDCTNNTSRNCGDIGTCYAAGTNQSRETFTLFTLPKNSSSTNTLASAVSAANTPSSPANGPL